METVDFAGIFTNMEMYINKKQNIVKAVLFFLEFTLLVVSVNLIQNFNINRLSAKQIMNVAFAVFAMIVLIIVYISCIYGKKIIVGV